MRKRRNSSITFEPKEGSTQWLGFDLDMTMIRYKIEPLGKHIYQAGVRYMVETLGYPTSLLEVRFMPSTFYIDVFNSEQCLTVCLLDSLFNNCTTARCIVGQGTRKLDCHRCGETCEGMSTIKAWNWFHINYSNSFC